MSLNKTELKNIPISGGYDCRVADGYGYGKKREVFSVRVRVRETIFEVVRVREKMVEIVLTGTGTRKREFFRYGTGNFLVLVRVRDFF